MVAMALVYRLAFDLVVGTLHLKNHITKLTQFVPESYFMCFASLINADGSSNSLTAAVKYVSLYG